MAAIGAIGVAAGHDEERRSTLNHDTTDVPWGGNGAVLVDVNGQLGELWKHCADPRRVVFTLPAFDRAKRRIGLFAEK
jgi:hypothetical protein